MTFAGQTAWITGASSGIGAALAQEWAGRGAHIILSGRDEARLAEVAEALPTETLILPFDVRDDAAMAQATQQAMNWRDGVDIAVANAGISQRSRALKTSMQVYRDIIAVDLVQQIAFSQGLIGHMSARKSGSLVFISSVAGKVGVPMRTAYSAAKFGLAGYADALRGELSQSGVGVHVIYPGSVNTDVSRNALTADGSARGVSDQAIESAFPPQQRRRKWSMPSPMVSARSSLQKGLKRPWAKRAARLMHCSIRSPAWLQLDIWIKWTAAAEALFLPPNPAILPRRRGDGHLRDAPPLPRPASTGYAVHGRMSGDWFPAQYAPAGGRHRPEPRHRTVPAQSAAGRHQANIAT